MHTMDCNPLVTVYALRTDNSIKYAFPINIRPSNASNTVSTLLLLSCGVYHARYPFYVPLVYHKYQTSLLTLRYKHY